MGSKSSSVKWLAGTTACLALAFFATTTLSHRTAAQTGTAAGNGAHPDMSGFWELRGTLRGRGAPPQYTPAGAQRAAERSRALANGDSGVTEVARWCRALGFPFYLTSSPPWDIVIAPNEIMVLTERQEASRRIFMDGRSHPDAAHLVPSANGDSIGHWEGDTLVVDTIGLKSGIDTMGTYRGPNQHIIERYKLLDKDHMSVSYSWEDPDVYAQPYTIERTYYRSDAGTYALEDWCDASDESQWHSDANPVTTPKKKVVQ